MNELLIQRKKTSYYQILVSAPVTLFLLIRALNSKLNSSGDNKVWIILILSVVTILCSVFLINSIVHVCKKSPALIINDNGIIDNSGILKLGLIKWDNISDCEIKKFTGASHLVVGLRESSYIISPLSSFKKRMAEIKIKDLGTPLAINSKLVDFDIIKLKEIIEEKINNANV